MGEQLAAYLTLEIAARDERGCRSVVDPLATRLAGTVEHVEDSDGSGRWRAVVRVVHLRWRDDGTDASYAAVVRDVLAELGVPLADLEITVARPTAHATLADPARAGAVAPGVAWLMVEAWEAELPPSDAGTEELDGEGPQLTPGELAELGELFDGLDATQVGLWVDLRGQDRAAARRTAEDLARRLEPAGDQVAVTGYEEFDDRVLRIGVHLGGSADEPAQAVEAALDRLGHITPATRQTPHPRDGLVLRENWTVYQDSAVVRAVWSSPVPDGQGVVRIEIVAGPASAAAD